MSAKAVVGIWAAVRMRVALFAAVVAIFAFTLSTAAHAAIITVNTLADPGRAGICALRDAIMAANTKSARHGCAAGTGSDQIQFSVKGTILIASTLPQVTDRNLTINGPASPGIKIDGGGKVQVMQVALGARLNLTRLGIANGNNQSTGKGGGIDNEGTLTVTNSTFSGNDSQGDGGGIENEGALMVTNSTFSQNVAQNDGGGIFNMGTLTVANGTFSGNGASCGGGISNFGTVTIANGTFSGNGAGFGGGISSFGTLTVTNGTFSGNGADFGGGIFNEESASLKSTILASSANSGNCSGTITDVGYNISDDTTCGFAKTSSANNGDGVNLLLSHAGLANNGGPTQTISLLPGSPAIDAIPLVDCTDQASPPHPIITDQRGFPRPDAGEGNCDIGAYESQGATITPFSSFSGSLTIDPDAGIFNLSGGFKLGSDGSIDPITQPVAFSVGGYAVRLPVGSFVACSDGYEYQKTTNGISLSIYINFTSTPGSYVLHADRIGGTLNSTTSPVPVTLTVGDDSGSTQMNATFD